MAASRARAADRAGAAHWRADEHHAGRARLAGANYGAGPRTAGGGLGHRPQPADRHRWLARDGLLDVLLVRVDALRPATHVRPLARRSTLRSVPRYRFEISWSVPTYRLDWIVMRYSWCRPLALIVRLLVLRVEASSFTDQAASTRCSNSRCHWHALVC